MISIETTDKTRVATPFHPDFPKAARGIGGKWYGGDKKWVFDKRDDKRVRELCVEIFGTDGTDAGETVTVRVEVSDEVGDGYGRTSAWEAHCNSLFLFGRQIARAYGRDSGARIGDGVVLISGSFESGGSMKNWYTYATPGTTFELRDVPKKAVENNGTPDEVTVKVIDETIDRDALLAEKTALLKRLEEIDNLLGTTK